VNESGSRLAVPALARFAQCSQVLATLLLWVSHHKSAILTRKLFRPVTNRRIYQYESSWAPKFLLLLFRLHGSISPSCYVYLPTQGPPGIKPGSQPEGEAQNCSDLLLLEVSMSPPTVFEVMALPIPNSRAPLRYPVLRAALRVLRISCGASWAEQELATRPNGPHPNQSSTYGLESLLFKVFSCITVHQENKWANWKRQTVEALITKVYFWYS